MSALLKHYEKVKAGLKTAEEEEQEAKERVLADKNPLRQGGYNAYIKAFDDDPYKYTNAEKSVLLAEFNPAIGTATLGIDSKQAFEDRRNVEGVIYGGGAFLSALGLGVVAKPISRGLGKVARFFTKRQDAKEMQEFLASDRGPAYTAEPTSDTPSFLTEPKEGVKKGLVGYETALDEMHPLRQDFLKRATERDLLVKDKVNTQLSRRSNVPTEMLGEFYSPVSEEFTSLTPKKLKQAGFKIYRQNTGPIFNDVGEIIGEADGATDLISKEDLFKYFRTLSAKGELEEGEFDYLIQNKLFNKNSDEIPEGTDYDMIEGKNIPKDLVSLSQIQSIYNRDIKDVFDVYTMSKDLQRTADGSESRFRRGLGQNQFVIDDEVDYEALTFNAQNLDQAVRDASKHGFKEDTLGHVRLSLRDGKDTLEKAKKLVADDRVDYKEARIGAKIQSRYIDNFDEELANLNAKIKEINEDTLEGVSSYGMLTDRQGSKLGKIQYLPDDTLKTIEDKGIQQYFDELLLSDERIKELKEHLYKNTRESRTAPDLEYKLNNLDNKKEEIAYDFLHSIPYDNYIRTSYANSDSFINTVDGRKKFIDDILTLANDKPIDEEFMNEIAYMLENNKDTTPLDLNYFNARGVDTEKVEEFQSLYGATRRSDTTRPALFEPNQSSMGTTDPDTFEFTSVNKNLITQLLESVRDLDEDFARGMGTEVISNYGKQDIDNFFDTALGHIQDPFDKIKNPRSIIKRPTRGLHPVYAKPSDPMTKDGTGRPVFANDDIADDIKEFILKKVTDYDTYTFRTVLQDVERLKNTTFTDDSKGDFNFTTRMREPVEEGVDGQFFAYQIDDTFDNDTVVVQGFDDQEILDFVESKHNIRLIDDEIQGSGRARLNKPKDVVNKILFGDTGVGTSFNFFEMPNGARVRKEQFEEIVNRAENDDLLTADQFNFGGGRGIHNVLERRENTFGDGEKYQISKTIRLDNLNKVNKIFKDMNKKYKETDAYKRGQSLPKEVQEFIDQGGGIKDKYFLVDELQSDLINKLARGSTMYLEQDIPIKIRGKGQPNHKEYVSKLLKTAIVRAKQRGVNKIVIPNYKKIREPRGGTPVRKTDAQGNTYISQEGGMPENIIRGAYKEGVSKSVNQLVRDSNNKIKTYKTKLMHTNSIGKNIEDLLEATVIDITDFDFNTLKGDIFRFNEGGYVGNVDSQMSELFN
jgi:hypothetical protein